jgi:hypothetical protein
LKHAGSAFVCDQTSTSPLGGRGLSVVDADRPMPSAMVVGCLLYHLVAG